MGILDNIKVVDFTHAYSGPFCSMNLADYGAEVIKIERIQGGDQARSWGPFKNDYSGYYASFNRGKKSVTLNIACPDGRKVIFDLIREADIVISNFKAGTLEKYGMGYEQMKRINPEIIYASLSGFGTQGELSAYAAYDNVIQGMSGIMDLNGFPDGDPTKIGPAIGDSYSGLVLLIGILIAYYHRLKTGEGQKIDATMLGSLITSLEYPIMEYTNLNKLVSRMGNRNLYYAPGDVYKTKDGYIAVSAKDDAQWETFCRTLEAEALLEKEEYETNELRLAHADQLKEDLEKLFAEHGMHEIEQNLEQAGIAAAHVMGIEEALEDEHLLARKMVIDVEDPGVGPIKLVGNPIKLSESKPVTDIPSPLLGENTEEILAEIGYTEEDINQLREEGVI